MIVRHSMSEWLLRVSLCTSALALALALPLPLPAPDSLSSTLAQVANVRRTKPIEVLEPWEYYLMFALIALLVIIGGIVAGLTLGLLSIDQTQLKILLNSGSEKEKRYARKIQPIVKNGHLLLVTLLLVNTCVNETLPILFHSVNLDGWQAILASTLLILAFGEIVPQAICSRFGLAVGAFFAWPVRILITILFVLAYPIARLLDCLLGEKHGMLYRRAELKELLHLHSEEASPGGVLTKDELKILRSVLDVKEQTVAAVMTPLDDVFMLSLDGVLNKETVESIIQVGHSRVPIYSKVRSNIIGVVLVKQLILYDPKDETPIRNFKLRRLPLVWGSTPLFEILKVFETGGSHMAVVVSGPKPFDISADGEDQGGLPDYAGASSGQNYGETIGIVTMEDVLESLLGEQIVDETDQYVSMKTKVRVVRLGVMDRWSRKWSEKSIPVPNADEDANEKDCLLYEVPSTPVIRNSPANGSAIILREPSPLFSPTTNSLEDASQMTARRMKRSRPFKSEILAARIVEEFQFFLDAPGYNPDVIGQSTGLLNADQAQMETSEWEDESAKDNLEINRSI